MSNTYKRVASVAKTIKQAKPIEMAWRDILLDTNIIDEAVGMAQNMRDEFDLASIAQTATTLAAGGQWDDCPLSMNGLANSRKQVLYVASASNIFSTRPVQHHDPLWFTSKYLGWLKDQPRSNHYACLLASRMCIGVTSEDIFGEPLQAADCNLVEKRVERCLRALRPLIAAESMEEAKYHQTRRYARKLAHAHVLSLASGSEPKVSTHAQASIRLSDAMGKAHGYEVQQQGSSQLAVSDRVHELANMLLTKSISASY